MRCAGLAMCSSDTRTGFRCKPPSVRLLLLTGCLKSEIPSLNWSDCRDGKPFLRDSQTGPGSGLAVIGGPKNTRSSAPDQSLLPIKSFRIVSSRDGAGKTLNMRLQASRHDLAVRSARRHRGLRCYRRRPQDCGGQGVAGATAALACSLHTDPGRADQSGRTLVRRTDAQAVAARGRHLNSPTRGRHPGLHRTA